MMLDIYWHLTSSNDVNIFACRKLKSTFGESNVYRLITVNEIKFDALSRPKIFYFQMIQTILNL